MSTNSLCLAVGSTYPFDRVKSVSVILAGDDLVVCSGPPAIAGGDEQLEVMVTDDPVRAAAKVVELLAAG
jgi:hypothetical protein